MIEMTYAVSAGEITGGVAGWATDLMDRLGAPGAGLAIALENLFPPLPSEVILPLAGFTAAQGDMNLAAAMACTTAGSVVGALVLYWVGVLVGRDRMRALVTRLPLVSQARRPGPDGGVVRAARRQGGVLRPDGPIFRSLISVPAGLERMRMRTFLLYTTLGSALWNTAFITAGYVLGDNWRTVERYLGIYSKAVLALFVLAVARSPPCASSGRDVTARAGRAGIGRDAGNGQEAETTSGTAPPDARRIQPDPRRG